MPSLKLYELYLLQDRRRPLWPAFVAAVPSVGGSCAWAMAPRVTASSKIFFICLMCCWNDGYKSNIFFEKKAFCGKNRGGGKFFFPIKNVGLFDKFSYLCKKF
jgi:hypothetical protein